MNEHAGKQLLVKLQDGTILGPYKVERVEQDGVEITTTTITATKLPNRGGE